MTEKFELDKEQTPALFLMVVLQNEAKDAQHRLTYLRTKMNTEIGEMQEILQRMEDKISALYVDLIEKGKKVKNKEKNETENFPVVPESYVVLYKEGQLEEFPDRTIYFTKEAAKENVSLVYSYSRIMKLVECDE